MFRYNPKRFFTLWCQIFVLFFTSFTVSLGQTSTVQWWNDAVFYEVFVRSFKDSDGDGKGDLKGLISKLDYLNDGDASTTTDLGVTALWLMPVQQSPSYHGYDVVDYLTVEQDYGTNQDFKDLIDEAHNRGIKVIIDFVMNHTSSEHPWFTESATGPTSDKRDWYVWNDTPPTITGPWGQTVWYANNSSNYYAIFWSGMPDLNYNTPAVKDTMFNIAEFWLEEMKVDGFRLDAVKYIKEDGNTLQDTPETIDFWQDFRTKYKSVNADAFAVGEAWDVTSKVIPYVENEGLDFCFEFDLASAIIAAANNGTTSGLKTQINTVVNTYPFLQYGTFLTNHDMNRVMSQLGSSVPKAKVAADLLFTLPGIPYMYYGEEIGMTGSGVDENKRTPLHWDNTAKGGFTTGTPWRAVNADYTTKNIAAQQTDATSLWNKYRSLISIRKEEAALRRGTYKSVTADTSTVIAFLRQYDDENILVVSNVGLKKVTDVNLTVTAGGISQDYKSLHDLLGISIDLPIAIDNTGSFTNYTVREIPAKTTYIYKLSETVVTGIENASGKSGISIYPMPASKEVMVNLPSTYSGTVNYQISDLTGAEKISASFLAGQNRVSCEGLASGLYLLTLHYNGSSEVFKIVVQK